jgi:hypothetical protein
MLRKAFLLAILFVFISIPKLGAQEISMFPSFWKMRYYQDDVEISRLNVEKLFKQDKEVNALWGKGKKHMTYAWIALGAEIGFLSWQVLRKEKGKSQTAQLIGVLGSTVVAIGFAVSSSDLKKKAILTYNNGLDPSTTLNIGATPNGLGFVIKL